jgi:hypothetical protein
MAWLAHPMFEDYALGSKALLAGSMILRNKIAHSGSPFRFTFSPVRFGEAFSFSSRGLLLSYNSVWT